MYNNFITQIKALLYGEQNTVPLCSKNPCKDCALKKEKENAFKKHWIQRELYAKNLFPT